MAVPRCEGLLTALVRKIILGVSVRLLDPGRLLGNAQVTPNEAKVRGYGGGFRWPLTGELGDYLVRNALVWYNVLKAVLLKGKRPHVHPWA